MKFYHSHGDTASRTRSYARPFGSILPHDGTPQHIVDSEMAMQSDMAERGRRLRAAEALRESIIVKCEAA